MFELSKEEWDILRCKISTLNGGEVNINIMRAFVAVRQMIDLPPTDKLAELQMKREREEKPRNPIGFIKPKT